MHFKKHQQTNECSQGTTSREGNSNSNSNSNSDSASDSASNSDSDSDSASDSDKLNVNNKKVIENNYTSF